MDAQITDLRTQLDNFNYDHVPDMDHGGVKEIIEKMIADAREYLDEAEQTDDAEKKQRAIYYAQYEVRRIEDTLDLNPKPIAREKTTGIKGLFGKGNIKGREKKIKEHLKNLQKSFDSVRKLTS